ncbi:hypothetical protein [Glutamicibacter sp. NPDC087344]|uniref:hypothetical protein n=1 Tax=Glutamicibacter sp. NPDC087344 TaxID=3363994 RepID=UPI003830D9A9
MKSEKSSILDKRIEAGDAEPISNLERQLARRIMRKYEEKHGTKRARELAENATRNRAELTK